MPDLIIFYVYSNGCIILESRRYKPYRVRGIDKNNIFYENFIQSTLCFTMWWSRYELDLIDTFILDRLSSKLTMWYTYVVVYVSLSMALVVLNWSGVDDRSDVLDSRGLVDDRGCVYKRGRLDERGWVVRDWCLAVSLLVVGNVVTDDRLGGCCVPLLRVMLSAGCHQHSGENGDLWNGGKVLFFLIIYILLQSYS